MQVALDIAPVIPIIALGFAAIAFVLMQLLTLLADAVAILPIAMSARATQSTATMISSTCNMPVAVLPLKI